MHLPTVKRHFLTQSHIPLIGPERNLSRILCELEPNVLLPIRTVNVFLDELSNLHPIEFHRTFGMEPALIQEGRNQLFDRPAMKRLAEVRESRHHPASREAQERSVRILKALD